MNFRSLTFFESKLKNQLEYQENNYKKYTKIEGIEVCSIFCTKKNRCILGNGLFSSFVFDDRSKNNWNFSPRNREKIFKKHLHFIAK